MAMKPITSRWVLANTGADQRLERSMGSYNKVVMAAAMAKSGAVTKKRSGTQRGGDCDRISLAWLIGGLSINHWAGANIKGPQSSWYKERVDEYIYS